MFLKNKRNRDQCIWPGCKKLIPSFMLRCRKHRKLILKFNKISEEDAMDIKASDFQDQEALKDFLEVK